MSHPDDDTILMDEAAVALMRTQRDLELIDESRDLERRMRQAGKQNDGDLVRAMRERMVDLMGGGA